MVRLRSHVGCVRVATASAVEVVVEVAEGVKRNQDQP